MGLFKLSSFQFLQRYAIFENQAYGSKVTSEVIQRESFHF